ncbi:DUF131 domain-containing protein [Methanimicrococcus sp. OttesenSCG-928-J09]|nr:DUF131 domain-containing protein [Methanimicrococcus sp. OttesenSCG-928-J09]
MADINVYFFWPSLIISIVLSILLTIGLNLWARRQTKSGNYNDYFENDHGNGYYENNNYENERYENKQSAYNDNSEHSRRFDDEPRTKTSGMIMIGPIPIVFGSSGFGFDKNTFKYALAFFFIIIIAWFILFRMVRL